MVEVQYDEEALRRLEALEADPTRSRLAMAVNDILDLLELDPGDGRLRRERFQAPPLWFVRISAADETWALLWEPHPTEANTVVVQYLGDASFS